MFYFCDVNNQIIFEVYKKYLQALLFFTIFILNYFILRDYHSAPPVAQVQVLLYQVFKYFQDLKERFRRTIIEDERFYLDHQHFSPKELLDFINWSRGRVIKSKSISVDVLTQQNYIHMYIAVCYHLYNVVTFVFVVCLLFFLHFMLQGRTQFLDFAHTYINIVL